MKKIPLLALLTLSVALLWRPSVAQGKAPTVRVTVSGVGLVGTMEITDPKVLALSHAWGSQFIDSSRYGENRPPAGLHAYEVSLYSEIDESEIRKACVFYYYPNTGSAQGFIYLPGSGVVWGLNAGTIVRTGQDGKWNYASPVWEAFIKPMIAGGGAPLSDASEVKTDGWTKPQPGWLYVLDPRSESGRPGSRVWLLDAVTEQVKGSIHVGFDADFALSPDGGSLYVASGERERGELSVIDTGSGEVRHIPFPDRVLYRPWYAALPPYYSMMVSGDGRVLRILSHHALSPGNIESQVRTFDTRSGHFLRESIQLGDCSYGGDFVSLSTASQFGFVCPVANTIRFVRLDADFRPVSSTARQLPWSGRCAPAASFVHSGGNKLAIIRRDGAIYEMELATGKFVPTPVAGDCREQLIYPHQWPCSPDGTKIYVGYGGLAPNGMSTSTELRVFDTATWHMAGSYRTSVPFWSVVASHDGKLIYALAPEQHCVLVLDGVTGREKRAISVGKTPTMALVAP